MAASKHRPASLADLYLFAKGFLQHPNMVGWLLPSSRFLVNELLKEVDWQRARTIIEFGPGLGAFTRSILQRMHPDARLIALEINPVYFGKLRSTLTDPRLHLLQESAADIDRVLEQLRCGQADYIISGIPFKTIPDDLRKTIVRKTHAVLKPDGRFLVYQFSSAVRPYLEQVFGSVVRGFEPLNILPARLFFCAR